MKRDGPRIAARRGYTMIEAMVVIVVIAVLVVVFLPALARSRARVSRIGCVNCLKQVGIAFKVWAGDNNDKFPMQVSVTEGGTMELVKSGVVYAHFQVMSNELATPKILLCPEDTSRRTAYRLKSDFNNWNASNVSFFIGVDADQTNPAMLLCADNNLGVGGVLAKPGLLALWTNSPVM